MRAIADPNGALAAGLAAIRARFKVPEAFPPEVLAAAEQAAKRAPTEHRDRTGERFVTLDPATSTDLDQAFAIERAGSDILLHYAIADVAWFVRDGDPVDAEAWTRGETLYLPDGRAPLYPPALSEAAASLLPGGPRAAVVFTVRVAPDGTAKLDGVERALIRNAAKLAYETVGDADLPPDFGELTTRIAAAELARGAARIDPPEQVVTTTPGGFALEFRPVLESEQRNAALSLATNLAVADLLVAHHTGLFRVMAEPDPFALRRLRHTAAALGVAWPKDMTFEALAPTLDAHDPKQAAFMLAERRAGRGASYAPYRAGETPWHSAIAATYAQTTAPLRRLADRYVIEAALAVANGRAVPDVVTQAFERLPKVMAKADAKSGQVSRAVFDLAEAVALSGRIGERFDAVVTDVDERGARIQLCDPAVVARVAGGTFAPGDRIAVKLTAADPERGPAFELS